MIVCEYCGYYVFSSSYVLGLLNFYNQYILHLYFILLHFLCQWKPDNSGSKGKFEEGSGSNECNLLFKNLSSERKKREAKLRDDNNGFKVIWNQRIFLT